MDRNVRGVLQQRRRSIGRRLRATEAVEYFNVLTGPELLETTEAVLPEHRERLYPPTVTLSTFMRQVLEGDGSCEKAVNGWAAQRVRDGLSACSVRTGAYCLEPWRRLTLQSRRRLTSGFGQGRAGQGRTGSASSARR
jgi:hypothetical protein